MHCKSLWLKIGSALLLAVVGGTAWAEEKQEKTALQKAPVRINGAWIYRQFYPNSQLISQAKAQQAETQQAETQQEEAQQAEAQSPCCEAKFTAFKVYAASESDGSSKPVLQWSKCCNSCSASASCCGNGCSKGCPDVSGACCCKGNACCVSAEMKPQGETKTIRAILIVVPSMPMPGHCPLTSLGALMPSLASMPCPAMPAAPPTGDPGMTPYLTVGMPGPSYAPQGILGREMCHGFMPLPSPMMHCPTAAMPYEMSPVEELFHWMRSCSPSHALFAYAPNRFLLRSIPVVDEAAAEIRKAASSYENELIGLRVIAIAPEIAHVQSAPWAPAPVAAPPACPPPPSLAPAYYYASGHNMALPPEGPARPPVPAMYHLMAGYNMMLPPPAVAAVPAPVAPTADLYNSPPPPPPPPVPECPVPPCTGNAVPYAVAATMTSLPSSTVRITEESGKHYLEMTGAGNSRMTCKKMTLRLSNGDFIKIVAGKQVKISNHLFKGCADQIRRGDEEDCWILEGNVSLKYLNRSKFALINADEVMIHLTDGRLEIKPVRFTQEPAQVPVVAQ